MGMIDPVDTGVQKYLAVIAAYDAEFKSWERRATKIVRRYRDDNRNQSGSDSSARFNILWSNVQTLVPAVYSKLPTADVSRRHGDNDQVGRVASLLIERALEYEIEHYPDFRATMKFAVQDRFLGGRGVAWVRYEPHVRAQAGEPDDGVQVTEDVDEDPAEEAGEYAGAGAGAEMVGDQKSVAEEIDYECSPVDYIHWKDFGHNVARTWEEVTEVWRWVYMSKDALVERFGEEKAATIPLDNGPEPLQGGYNQKRDNSRAKICELWCKETGKVYWLSKSATDFIDVRDDPLELQDFFPCGRPLYATLTSDSLVPVPDFVLYQDQAVELDILSDRIDGLVKALRVRGVYDASQPALARLLTEGENNALIPVVNWAGFGEKGGLKGSIDLLPLDTLAAALMQCYGARTEIKNQIYEITGISDIIRGQTAASETATAQQIKGRYAGLRLRSMQEDVALFATDLLRLKTQVICSQFQPETILEYAAAAQMSEADQQMIPQALELLKNKPMRNFRVEVASDSLVQLDEDAMKQDRLQFIQTFGGFMREALPAGQASPQLVPILFEVLRFGVSAFKSARALEGSIDQAMKQFVEASKQPQPPPPPNPEMMKLQQAGQIEQMRMQADGQREQMRMQAEGQAMQAKAQFDAQVLQAQLQADMQIEQLKAQSQLQIEQMKAEATAAIEQQRIAMEEQAKLQEMAQVEQFDRWKAELESATRIRVAEIAAGARMEMEPVL
jgi:hypothetical protein